jgi:hypothetical protein
MLLTRDRAGCASHEIAATIRPLFHLEHPVQVIRQIAVENLAEQSPCAIVPGGPWQGAEKQVRRKEWFTNGISTQHKSLS